MQNWKTSAGTAAKQSSKSSLLVRSALILAILMLSAVFCKGQSDSTYSARLHKVLSDSNWIKSSGINSVFAIKDSCWWTQKIDTIQTDFVITVDENNFVKKQRTDFIVHSYEKKYCPYSGVGSWEKNTRNDNYLLDGKSVEVILYRPKTQLNTLMVGNSR